ncbi:hypothetical protein AB0K18_38470 [Nonomuraea sp. NPDC049421]|uniref:hypothetical protein n=1 Tax=Nonomuraea sp. NPDC049421 TaxID=3155275 RepID=UPI00341C3F17
MWHPAERLVLDLLAARLGRAHRRDLKRAPEWAPLEKRIRRDLVRRGLLRRGTLGPTQAGDAACRAALAAHPARDGTLESYVLHGPPTLVPALVMTAPEEDDDDPGGGTGDGWGRLPGREVFHLHLHVVPRYPGDGIVIAAGGRRRARGLLDRDAALIRGMLPG